MTVETIGLENLKVAVKKARPSQNDTPSEENTQAKAPKIDAKVVLILLENVRILLLVFGLNKVLEIF